MKRLLIPIILFAFVANASAQTSKVTFMFDHTVGTTPLVLNQTEFTIWNGKKVVLTRAEFYISEVALKKQDGTMLPLTDRYIHVNANAPTAVHDLDAWNTQTAQSVTLHLGVDSAHNHLDPGFYPQTHPLAYKNPSMHWGWVSGYRFFVVEGKIDNNGDGVPESNFEVHSFNDNLYKTLTIETLKPAVNGVLRLRFALDYAQLFKNIAMTGGLIQHGNYAMNDKMMANAVTENFFSVSLATATEDVAANSQKMQANPNPFATETMIQYDLPSKNAVTLVVTNLLGQVVRTVNDLPNSGSVRFQKDNLPNGMYQANFYGNGNLIAHKKMIISE
jgi:hypothetical protein